MNDPQIEGTLSRREFLKMAGTVAAGAALTLVGGAPPAQAALPTHPNLLIIVSDQERYPRYWPTDWDKNNLPAHERLKANGLTFTQAFCNSSMCSPSRATLFTGLYPEQHGLKQTGTPDFQLPLSLQNMARMLAAAGYNVQLRGKWHLSYKADHTYPPTAQDVANYGFKGWVPTAAGEGTNVAGYGAGCADNDATVADQAIAFLNSPEAAAGPFALIVTLVNPHDVLAYPGTWESDTCGGNGYGDLAGGIPDEGILYTDIPSRDEDLANNNKPAAQNESKQLYLAGLGYIGTPTSPPGNLKPRDYVNFYAYLTKLMDAEVGRVLDAVKDPNNASKLRDDVVVVYTSDHGEMGLSHGGLRQKMFNVYEETIHVPLIISNPVLFPTPQITPALAALVDVMPTLASLANVPNPTGYHFSGADLSPLFTNTGGSVQDAILFTFDDEDAGQEAPPPSPIAISQPNHIRCVREARWKYARYFDPANVAAQQYELYDLQTDPHEMTNLATSTDTAVVAEKARLAAKLAQLEATHLKPFSFLYLPTIQR